MAKESAVRRGGRVCDRRPTLGNAVHRGIAIAGEASDRLLAAMFKASPIGMVRTGPDARIIEANSAFEAMVGYGPGELVGLTIAELTDLDDLPATVDLAAQLVSGGTASFRIEKRLVRRDGARIWVEETGSAVPSGSGRSTCLLSMVVDITERRRRDEKRRQLEQEKSQLVHLAVHELRGPMTVMKGWLKMLAQGDLGELSERGKQVAPMLVGRIDEMDRLIGGMLEVSRLEEGSVCLRVEEVDLGGLVEEAASRARNLSVSHPIVLHLPRKTVSVRVDAERTATIISNLLSNAVKYSPDGGDVEIVVGTRRGRGVVMVKDRGVGIAAEDLTRLFGRFCRFEHPDTRRVPGLGLGLHLSQELARRMGGHISVKSQIGIGSSFWLHLPLARGACVELAAAPAGGGGKVDVPV